MCEFKAEFGFTEWRILYIIIKRIFFEFIIRRRKETMNKFSKESLRMRIAVVFMAITMAFPIFASPFIVVASEDAKSVDVMFVHDLHSHLNPFETVEGTESVTMGGMAKIMTIIKAQKQKNDQTLLLDAGDFSMGTLVQAVYEDEASELRMLGALGIDATTFGNHEFDYGIKGLAKMLETAMASGEKLPQILACNIDWDAMKADGLTEEQKLAYETFEKYGVKEYTVVEKGGVKIAVIGVFGEDAYDCVARKELKYRDPVKAVKETVADIEANENVDMIVCVSHGGTWSDGHESEDEIIAKKVPQVDLIISGHTHTKLDEPIKQGNAYIVSCEEYGKYVGNISMTQKTDGNWEMKSYELIAVDTSVAADAETQAKVDYFMSLVDERYLKKFGYTKDQILCTNEVTFAPQVDLSLKHTEINLGSIIADAYAYAVENAVDFDGNTVHLAVAPSGTIRDTYAKGNITVENVFNSFSLGIGADGVPGYPLISAYLTGEELKLVAEIDSSISDFMTTARLYTYGLRWTYNPNRLILNKTTDVYLHNSNGERVELEDDKLYRVVTDMYSALMLGGVTEMSYGLLSLVPKFADGTPIKDYNDAIIKVDGEELKAWVAIAQYMQSFDDTDGDGVPNVPEKYATEEGRKVVDNDKSIGAWFKNPSKFFYMIMGVLLVVLAILVVIIIFIVKLIKKLVRKLQKAKIKSNSEESADSAEVDSAEVDTADSTNSAENAEEV